MGAAYLILPDKQLIIGRFTGPTGADDIQSLLHRIWADPLFDRTFALLMDFTRAALRLGFAEVTSLCNCMMSIAGGVMGGAAILASGPVGTALAMLFSKGISLFAPSEVFSTWEGARDFLGIELDKLPDF